MVVSTQALMDFLLILMVMALLFRAGPYAAMGCNAIQELNSA